MSRPKAEVILKHQGDLDTVEVLASPGIWFVCYESRPVALVKKTWSQNGELVKYPRTGFNNPSHAYKLAERLNAKFFTDRFTVKEVK